MIRAPQAATSVADKLVILSPINRNGDEIYVHSKHIVVDDVFMSIGSCNHTARGTTYEMEMNAAILGNRLNFGGTDVVEMFARQKMEAWVVPMALDHRVGPELVAVPRGENETARKFFQKVSQFRLVAFRP